jgi:hypothetical protein
MRSKNIYAFSVNNRLSTPSEKQKKKNGQAMTANPKKYRKVFGQNL